MILLPIGHEETGVRRLPWVTFAIMGICLLAFIASGRAGPGWYPTTTFD
jgi:hypothetical protein